MGLTISQIAAANWDESKPGLPLFRQLVKDRVTEAMKARAEIQAAPDDTTRAIQEARHHALEGRVAPIRTMGDAVISAFFAADKAKEREKKRTEIESLLTGSLEAQVQKLEAVVASLRSGTYPILPFHWHIEFPEVFVRENGGFDAIVGNPPFLGGSKISGNFGHSYLAWLLNLHEDSHGNSDLVAHFFRRAFTLLRRRGNLELIATNTIGQGDTRTTGLAYLLLHGGAIAHAIHRLKWPGEAAVVVSIVGIVKGQAVEPILDGRRVRRISAYLNEGELDASPLPLVENSGKAFGGSKIYGQGFLFDDAGAIKGNSSSVQTMRNLIEKNERNSERIFPYIGGEEVNNDRQQSHDRYVIDFEELTEGEARTGWPDLFSIVEALVKPERDKQNREARKRKWWLFGDRQPGLYRAIANLDFVFATNCGAAPHLAFARLPARTVFAHSLTIVAFSTFAPFAVLQSRVHELWAWFFSSTLEDRLRYAPSDCFRTFVFPKNYESTHSLEQAGATYNAFRAQLMIDRNEGLTKTYNRFHANGENGADIARLRELHADVDAAVLRAYGWDDLTGRAMPEFIEQDADEGKTPKTRFDWPSEFKEEVLARLLALNAERAATERSVGLAPVAADDDETEEVDA